MQDGHPRPRLFQKRFQGKKTLYTDMHGVIIAMILTSPHQNIMVAAKIQEALDGIAPHFYGHIPSDILDPMKHMLSPARSKDSGAHQSFR